MSDDADTGESKDDGDASAESAPPAPIHLRCLAGGTMPEELRRDAERFSRLPEPVVADLGLVLRACVLEPMTPEVRRRLDQFCRQNEVADADLGGVLKVCGWLLAEAAQLDLSEAELVEDVSAIWSDSRALADTLAQEYGPFKRSLREQLLSDALVRHGNVLLDVDWRVDRVASERSAAKIDAAIAMVTLAYRNSERTERLTLQIPPDKLDRLCQIFGALAQKVRLLAR